MLNIQTNVTNIQRFFDVNSSVSVRSNLACFKQFPRVQV
jgi:hypothetical protein